VIRTKHSERSGSFDETNNQPTTEGCTLRLHPRSFIKTALASLSILAAPLWADTVSVVVSVPEQKMYVFNDGGDKVASYRISTSQYGIGDGRGTYATPAGQLAISGKIGDGADIGTVFKGRCRTGEVCKINARGRDPIVTRVLPLRGLEKHNSGAENRRIYIHGTPDERNIGKPVSYGCIRMRSRDVIELFDMVNVGTRVEITQDRVSAGMFAKVTRRPAPSPVAAGPAPKAVASVKVPSAKGTIPAPMIASTPKPETKSARPASGGAKLLETSGLTISFGGGEGGDRPK
jgi:hypothetical protein